MIDYVRHSRAHIFVDDLADDLVVKGDDHHHLTRVMRLETDDHISAACNGSVREYIVEKITRDELHAHALKSAEVVDEPAIHIAASLFKMDRLEWGIAKAIEAGALSITIGKTSRSSISLDSNRAEKFLRRTDAIARAAAMQSRRARIIPVTLVDGLIEYCCAQDTSVVLCDPSGNKQAPDVPVTILIGPEGGFDDDEIAQLDGQSEAWCISPHILRSETAMAVAPALISANISL